ncbi:MAG: glutamate--tRNA ligase [Gammaproteobacteria bacterium RIFCSPHIGHO2_12_FULL_40_19]|nr:MAG: glutamate--tRNA ligase [Gammaproteobacteria bacterium RIFCSPHIGHO2_12_FULL_40_19]
MFEKPAFSSIKTRFCPSPTGYIHLGNVRTALFSALLAKHLKGCFLLRIEDTDKARSDEVFTHALIEDLRWLGLHWDEGVEVGGEFGPYHQSHRQNIYDDYYERLIAMKMAYPCFCTEAQLSLHRTLQQKSGKPPRYSGACRRLSETEIQNKIAMGIKPTLRFQLLENETITFVDMVRGEQRFESNDLGDFVIRRADGTAPFMYGNAIDDALMGVTHVLRGEDHVANTPRQIAILKALSLPVPKYGHIALIVGPDGSPLSKRHGSRSLRALREEGFLPLAILNYLSRLGHYFGHDQFLSLDELAAQFKMESLAKSPAKYNEKQLLFWQTQTVSQLSDNAFWEWVGPSIQSIVPENKQHEFVAAIKPNVQFPLEVKQWAEALFAELPSFNEQQEAVIQSAGKAYFSEAIIALEAHGKDAEKITTHLKEKVGVKGKALFMPLRIALTGHEHGPDLGVLFSLISPKTMKRRFERGVY